MTALEKGRGDVMLPLEMLKQSWVLLLSFHWLECVFLFSQTGRQPRLGLLCPRYVSVYKPLLDAVKR